MASSSGPRPHLEQPQAEQGPSEPTPQPTESLAEGLPHRDARPEQLPKRRRLSHHGPLDNQQHHLIPLTQPPGDAPSPPPTVAPAPFATVAGPGAALGGPSRDRGAMQRSITPPDGSNTTKYTRTGRVSKALKGQRVHHCDECGKTYTRHEHLRRHQQNHRPGAFTCDIPGCSRSFNREDLLIRHKARHNDPSSPSTRPVSVESSRPASDSGTAVPPTPAPPSMIPKQRQASIGRRSVATQPPPPGAPQDGQTRSTRRKNYIPITELHRAGLSRPIPLLTEGSHAMPSTTYQQYHFPASSPEHSSSGEYDDANAAYPYAYASPLPYSQPHIPEPYTSMSGDMSYQAPATSRSPVSASSNNTAYGQWYDTTATAPFLGQPMYANVAPYSEHHDIYTVNHSQLSLHIQRDMMAEQRDAREREELSTPTTAFQHEINRSQDETFEAAEARYSEAFWNNIHPQYPVVYKPDFSLQTTSPLLKAAALALGAQSQGGRIDVTNARILHERCTKVLKKRSVSHTHSFRTCDMQAIVLIEIFSVFKSRRPPTQFSKLFEDVYQTLALDSDVISHTLTAATQECDPYTNMLAIDQECKQRLLAACYTLDFQHAALFGRQKTSFLGGSGLDLSFPRQHSAWDDHRDLRRLNLTVKDELDATQGLATPVENPPDFFGSMLLMSGITDSSSQNHREDYINEANPSASPLLFGIEQSSRARIAFHTLMLSKSAPVRDLLAVAGETWILSEKLSRAEEYTRCQLSARDWATRGMAVAAAEFGNAVQATRPAALTHAFEILKTQSQLKSRTSLLFQEWAIYLAAITIWAHAYVSEQRRRPRLSIPSPVEPRLSAHELEQAVNALLDAGAGATYGLKEAKNVLMWVRAKIEFVEVHHQCGLTSVALDVLGKLITRGNEDGWF